MVIVYTRHAQRKFADLEKLGLKISKRAVRKVISHPENIDRKSDFPNIIASSVFDKDHILRVVFRRESGKIAVITFYPARKGRYYEV